MGNGAGAELLTCLSCLPAGSQGGMQACAEKVGGGERPAMAGEGNALTADDKPSILRTALPPRPKCRASPAYVRGDPPCLRSLSIQLDVYLPLQQCTAAT